MTRNRGSLGVGPVVGWKKGKEDLRWGLSS